MPSRVMPPVLLALIVATACAQETPKKPLLNSSTDPFEKVTDAESFSKAVQVARRTIVATLYQQRDTIRWGKGTDQEKRGKISEINEQIATINNPTKPYIPEDYSDRFIVLDSGLKAIHVVKVVDARNAIVKSVIASPRRVATDDFWLTGITTAGWIEDANVEVHGLLLAVGIKSIPKVEGGEKNIRLMKRIDFDPRSPGMQKAAGVRLWRKKNGDRHTGALAYYDQGRVRLILLDGRNLDIPLEELSATDRDYVSKQAPAPKRQS